MNAPAAGGAAAWLGVLARGLFPANVAVATADPRLAHAGLFPEEAPAIAGAVERRRREYTAGRVAARRAMAELGVPAGPVLSGEDRAPIWPEGLVGSISHSSKHCLAVVARSSDTRSIGVDIEPDEPLDAHLLDSICTSAETTWLDSQLPVERLRLAKLIFSAKESAYKCQYPLTQTLLEFHQVELRFDRATNRFTATVRPADGALGTGYELHGRYMFFNDAILTAVALSRAARKLKDPESGTISVI